VYLLVIVQNNKRYTVQVPGCW